MADEQAIELLLRAEQCDRLAKEIRDPRTIAVLQSMASQYREQADHLASDQSIPVQNGCKPTTAGEDEPRQVFARNLVEARRQAGMTQSQLSQASGISQSHISQIENAMFEPKLTTILTLSAALGVDASDLMPRRRSR